MGRYTDNQLDLIRRSLQRFFLFGSGIPGKKLTSRRVIEEIGVYTDLRIPDAQDDLENLVERVRQFAFGPSKRNPEKRRDLDSQEELECIVDFLTHPEINYLKRELLMQPDMAYQAAFYLQDYLYEQKPITNSPLSIEGYFLSPHLPHQESLTIQINIKPYLEQGVLQATEIRSYGLSWNAPHIVSYGWASLTPENMLFLLLKAADDFENTYYLGLFDLGAFSINNAVESLLLIHAPKPLGFPERSQQTLKSFIKIDDGKQNAKAYDFMRQAGKDIMDNIIILQRIDGDFLHKSQVSDTLKEYDDLRSKKPKDHPTLHLYAEGQFHQRELQLLTQQINSRVEKDILGDMLIKAVKDFDDESIPLLLKEGAPVNYQHPETGLTSLHYAASRNYRYALRVLSKVESVDFLIRDNRNRLAVDCAVNAASDPVAVRYLWYRTNKQAREAGILPMLEADIPALTTL